MSAVPIAFDNTYARLPGSFFAPQIPAKVAAPTLIRMNTGLAAELGIDVGWLGSEAGLRMVAGNVMPAGAEPIAQVYAGHQFGQFVPRLGDGRAILLGEVERVDGARRDIQLKGAGRTAYSRGGDGKAALGPVLREYIVSEAMHALGVPSTRALAAVRTGETVQRETRLEGGVLTRVAASHIRVGTFQYFAARGEEDALRALVDYTVARHYPRAAEAANPALALLEAVIAAQCDLVTGWLHLGFIHGVMNTDNVAVSGETIDFGPCAFMDEFHPQRVFSAIDRGARYAWGNQPAICQWNLTRLAETLLPLLAGDADTARERAEAALAAFPGRFQRGYLAGFRAKLGLTEDAADEGGAFVKSTLSILAAQEVDFTLFFRRLTEVAAGGEAAPLVGLFAQVAEGESWLRAWRAAAAVGAGLDAERVRVMWGANPVLIPRNHQVEAAIQGGYAGDFTAFHRLVDALAQPYADRAEYRDLEAAPRPEERVTQTFCGT